LVAGIFCFLILGVVGVYFMVDELMNMNQLPLVGQKILVIPIKGEITMEGCSGSFLTGVPACARVDDIKRKLEYADSSSEIKAVILDINSGGGGVSASRELMEAVRDTQKPVVARIGEVGASGAYYAASAADWVIAYQDSMTGSIGVIMTLQHYYGLYGKLGINVTVIKSGDSKDLGSPYRPIREEEKDELKHLVDKIYDDFISDVAVNRNLSYSYTKNLSDGSIYLGSEARDYGLVDQLGDMDDAVDKAKELGEIVGEPDIVRVVERKRTLFDVFNFGSKLDIYQNL